MHVLALVWIAVILALMPVQAIWSRRKVSNVRPTRVRAYASTISGLLLMGAVMVVIDRLAGQTGIKAAKHMLSQPFFARGLL